MTIKLAYTLTTKLALGLCLLTSCSNTAKIEPLLIPSNTPTATKVPASPQDEQTKTSAKFMVGDYQYSGYSKKGDKIIEGRLSITSNEKERAATGFINRIKGDWDLKSVRAEPLIGSQVGNGDLMGQIDENSLYIDLNPNVDDGNVILEGQIDDKGFRGKWRAVGEAGTINEGSFDAKMTDRK